MSAPTGPVNFSGDTLRSVSDRAQQLRAVTAVLRAIPDPKAQREVLDALFAEGRRNAPRGFRERAPRDESTLKPHGTEAAYQRHKARGEKACQACLNAANEARLESKRRKREEA